VSDGAAPDAAADRPAASGEQASVPAPAVDADAVADRWTDPYRWACPRGHVFQRTFDPRGPVECYSCERTHDTTDLVDRKRESAPPWHARQGSE